MHLDIRIIYNKTIYLYKANLLFSFTSKNKLIKINDHMSYDAISSHDLNICF